MRFLILFIYCLFITRIQAQMCPCEFGDKPEKSLRNEVGINLFNVNEALFNFNSIHPVYQEHYANGIMIKHHFDKFSARIGYDYFKNSYRYEAGELSGSYYNLNRGKSSGSTIRIGVEKTLIGQKLQPYFILDLVYSGANYEGTDEGHTDIPVYTINNYKFKEKSLGVSPAFGIKYRPLRHFSISAEIAVSLIHYQTKSPNLDYNESSSALLLNPLRQLSFNYHF